MRTAELKMPKAQAGYLSKLYEESPFLYNRMVEVCDHLVQNLLLDNKGYHVDTMTVLNSGVLRPTIDVEEHDLQLLVWSFQYGEYTTMPNLTEMDMKMLHNFMHYMGRSN